MLFSKKRNFLILIIFLMSCISTGCNINKVNDSEYYQNEIKELSKINDILLEENNSLTETIKQMKINISELQSEVELNSKLSELFPPAISYNYLENTGFYVFVDHETNIKMLPFDNAQVVNIIFDNSLIKVLDKAQVQTKEEYEKNKFWYYVEIVVYDTPMNTKGWIRVEETSTYTEENKLKVLSPITIKDGSKIYEYDSPFNNDKAEYELSSNENGRIEEFYKGYVRIMSHGGRDFWTKVENVIYPNIHNK